MTTDGREREGDGESGGLAPETAFDVLGNGTRLQILKALTEADDPLSYSDLFERVEYDDSANFTYHLDRLVGHFVRKTDDGYTARLAGRRVVESIFSGVVTEAPVVDRTPVDTTCMYCDNTAEMAYYDEAVLLYCDECQGRVGDRRIAEEWPIPSDDVVGYVGIPPAGVRGRSPTEILETAGVFTVAGVQTIVRGVCPRCSAPVERTPRVCEDHDDTGEFCEQCDHQFAVSVDIECTNCPFTSLSPYPTQALGEIELLAFMTEHDIDPFVSDGFHLRSCEEAVVTTDPLRAEYTFGADGDTLTLIIDGDLSVTDVTRTSRTETSEG